MNEQCGYDVTYGELRSNPIRWWEQAAADIHWHRRWLQTFDATQGPYWWWFVGGMLNTCFNCVDRHVEAGRGGQAALIWESPMTGQVQAVTYSQLLEQTAKLAGALATLGVRAGDRVLLYMPMVPKAVIAMLAGFRVIEPT